MQIAPTQLMPYAEVTQALDIVPPSTLFSMASKRGFAALHLLNAPEGRVPSAATAELALHEAQAGERILRSALVPGMPFYQRQNATAALDHLQAASTLLIKYAGAVATVGSGGTLHAERISGAAHSTLREARDRLIVAVTKLALDPGH